MKYLGDIAEDQITYFRFSTHKADGTPITLAGTPAISVYKNDDDTQSTAGVTLSVDDDSVTGMHTVKLDTSADAFYAAGADYSVVITTGTVDSVSVVGTVLATFSIENRAAYTATVQASPVILAAEIATVTSQTVFTLATGSDQNDAYNQHEIVLFDDSNNDYTCRRTVLDYVGASKTVTIDSAPNFTLAADDSVKIFVAPSSRIKIVA